MKKACIILAGCIVLLLGVLYFQHKKINRQAENYQLAVSLNKAYQDALDSAVTQNRAFQVTLDGWSAENDKLAQELKSTQERLEIKNKNLQSAHYIKQKVELKDTVITDTIFKNEVSLDTAIVNQWYQVGLKLQYPDTVIVSPSLVSELEIFTSLKKETVNPPKKWWLLRLFQKKHNVLTVNVEEKNPYIKVEQSRYFKIIK